MAPGGAAGLRRRRRQGAAVAADSRRPDCVELLRHAIEALGLKGAKFGPIYNGVALEDPRLEPVYEYLQNYNLPLTMHMGTTFARNARMIRDRDGFDSIIAPRWSQSEFCNRIPPTADLRVSISGFMAISSASPSGADLASSIAECLFLTLSGHWALFCSPVAPLDSLSGFD